MLFLTPHDIALLFNAFSAKWIEQIEISLDAGMTTTPVLWLNNQTIQVFGKPVELPDLQKASKDLRSILKYENGEWLKWQRFDPRTGKFYKMIWVAPGKPPTIEISGIKMHVTQNSDPAEDTARKLAEFRHLKGKILDTCLGLGYTAIQAAEKKKVEQVIVCENDRNVYELCRENPWSKKVFQNEKIQLLLKSVSDFVATVPNVYFDAILHDPPRFALAPELYSERFYTDLSRILKPGGQLYHFIGNPNQRIRKRSLAEVAKNRLTKTGFQKAKPAYFGVKALK